MNATRDPEVILTAWLDEGPSDLPDVTRRAILTALPTTPQARRGPIGQSMLSRLLLYPRLAAAVLVAVIVVGGGMYLLGQRNAVGPPAPTVSPAVPSPTPSAGAAASAAQATDDPYDTSFWIPFTSELYGFTVSRPSIWTQQPASGHWTYATQRDSDADILWSPSGWPEFVGFATKIPAGKTADQFLQAYNADGVATACYPSPSSLTRTTVDGHPATIAYAGCNEHFYYSQAVVVIGRRIWIFVLYGPDRSLIVPFLSTIKIDPSAVVD